MSKVEINPLNDTVAITSGSSKVHDDVEVCQFDGKSYVAVYKNSRGFSNTGNTILAEVTDVEACAYLADSVERDWNRQPGDNYRCDWMSRKGIAQHIIGHRKGNKPVLVSDAEGNAHSIMI